MSISWHAGSGSWFGRIVFGLLAAVLLIVAALVSIVVLARLALGMLALLAIVMWKARIERGGSWAGLRGKRPPPGSF